MKLLCKLPHDKLVYQNKFHNFWNYSVAYKNPGNCIYQLMDWIFEHYKFIQISSFIFLNHNRACTEATQKISEFLELWLFSYKFPKIQHYSKSENNKRHYSLSCSHWQPAPTCHPQPRALTVASTTLIGANSLTVSPTATAKVPTRSQELGASFCGTLEVDYDMEQGWRRPWRMRWHGSVMPAKQGQ